MVNPSTRLAIPCKGKRGIGGVPFNTHDIFLHEKLQKSTTAV